MQLSAHRKRRVPLSAKRIQRSMERPWALAGFDFVTPIDRSRLFVCPTLSPLFYTSMFSELSQAQRRRYNQLTALSFGELISFFEGAFEHALHASKSDAIGPSHGAELDDCINSFIAEEVKHREMWRRLALLSEPTWYESAPRRIVRIGKPMQWLLRFLSRRPRTFPVVVWLMLALEEHSLEISRRCAKLPPDEIEPRYAAVYSAHMQEEVRHVQIDWHLLVRLMKNVPPWSCRLNGWLFRQAIKSFFYRPTRAAVRVIDQLIKECPELRTLRRPMVRQLKALRHNQAYRHMMLSPQSTPITFALMKRYPELQVPSS